MKRKKIFSVDQSDKKSERDKTHRNVKQKTFHRNMPVSAYKIIVGQRSERHQTP